MFLWKLDHDELLGHRVAEVAAESGKSNNALAKLLNIDRRCFAGINGGKLNGIRNAWHLYKFCKYTGVSADYLLGLTDEKRYFNERN